MHVNTSQMMMIAFVSINGGLVPLIEGLALKSYIFRFEIIGGLRSHLLLFFSGRKKMSKKKAVSSRSRRIYIHMCTLYTYTNIFLTL